MFTSNCIGCFRNLQSLEIVVYVLFNNPKVVLALKIYNRFNIEYNIFL